MTVGKSFNQMSINDGASKPGLQVEKDEKTCWLKELISSHLISTLDRIWRAFSFSRHEIHAIKIKHTSNKSTSKRNALVSMLFNSFIDDMK